jgi:hypothetical protein
MGSERAWKFLSWSLSVAAVSCCGCSSNECDFSCPGGAFAVEVPNDRVSDVLNLECTGPCSCSPELSAVSPPGGIIIGHGAEYLVFVGGVGVCHVNMSFMSGAPDFVADVKTTLNPGPCCVGEPEPETATLTVPENGRADAATDH